MDGIRGYFSWLGTPRLQDEIGIATLLGEYTEQGAMAVAARVGGEIFHGKDKGGDIS